MTGRFWRNWEKWESSRQWWEQGRGRIFHIQFSFDSVESEVLLQESQGGHGPRKATGLGGGKDCRAFQRGDGGRRWGRTVRFACGAGIRDHPL